VPSETVLMTAFVAAMVLPVSDAPAAAS